MSIKREQGEKINSCKKLHKEVNKHSPLPIKICLDVDHGDVSSNNKDDFDPCKWLKIFLKDTAYIHWYMAYDFKMLGRTKTMASYGISQIKINEQQQKLFIKF